MDDRKRRTAGKSRKASAAMEEKRGGKPGADDLYVVGIGGSAGGLEAFERLFAGMPRDTGMVFVVIQHLDPKHKALMPELLQRATALKVMEIVDGAEIEPDCIFVLPPGQYVSIGAGRLWLSPATPPLGTRTPVDSFFTSLAADRKDKAIGIVVSGMGMDGTVGIRAIKEQLGVVLVQDPESAKYDGMPTSAAGRGYAGNTRQLRAARIASTQQGRREGPPCAEFAAKNPRPAARCHGA